MSTPPPTGPHQPEGQQPWSGQYPQGSSGQPPHPGGPYGQQPYAQGPYDPGPYPQGPYGPSPYPAWGQGYSPYTSPAPVDGFAVASLVLGVLCCVPGVGLVLGLVALSRIRARGERGRGLAIGGSVLSGLGLAAWVLVLATGGASSFWEGVEEGARGGAGITLSRGECFDEPGGSLEGETYDIDRVSCAGRHDGEVFATFRLPAGPYPGEGRVADTADERCYGLQDGYAMDSWAVPDDVDLYHLTPTPESWRAGDHEVTCVFGSADAGGDLTGSLRNDETVLDADQVAYLRAAHVLNAALDSAPVAEYVEDDLPGHRAWAGRVAAALAEQSRMLAAHDWPAGAKRPVTDLLPTLTEARDEWAAAAEATDADAFATHYEKGAGLLDPGRTVTARKALGLATTPPDDGPAGGGQGGGADGGTDGGGMQV
ncbi:DUF4190 domain-containing protein [Streptomyces sp. NPDC026672]|uniref:DUF4190 domain-containing protein n=1 Tax=unclassified Streptomyces TaxID=2593676 RepID=UPI0034111903